MKKILKEKKNKIDGTNRKHWVRQTWNHFYCMIQLLDILTQAKNSKKIKLNHKFKDAYLGSKTKKKQGKDDHENSEEVFFEGREMGEIWGGHKGWEWSSVSLLTG